MINRRREIAERVAEKYRRARQETVMTMAELLALGNDLTIEEINEDIVPLEMLFDGSLDGCDKHWLEEMGILQ